MGTAEWIALGLLSFIALIGWLRWKKDEPSQVLYDRKRQTENS